MPLIIIRDDITKVRVDAIVNAANNSLLGGGGVDGCIHRAAGKELLKECKTLGGCATGEAKTTLAYRLPCKYVIHTVGPVWTDGMHGERLLLESSYKSSLREAASHGCKSVAFPLISSGAYGYPKTEALQIATDVITDFLGNNDMTVYLVIFDSASFDIGKQRFKEIEQFIDDNYVGERYASRDINSECMPFSMAVSAPDSCNAQPNKQSRRKLFERDDSLSNAETTVLPVTCEHTETQDLAGLLQQLDESFSQMLLRKIDESGISDAQCYKRANIDRKLFSKIRNDIHYKPSKQTAIAFAIALELGFDDTCSLLQKAGFALSHSNKFDVIIEYFIRNGNYDVFAINEALFAFDQLLLGV